MSVVNNVPLFVSMSDFITAAATETRLAPKKSPGKSAVAGFQSQQHEAAQVSGKFECECRILKKNVELTGVFCCVLLLCFAVVFCRTCNK